jgi:hypothetical protein
MGSISSPDAAYVETTRCGKRSTICWPPDPATPWSSASYNPIPRARHSGRHSGAKTTPLGHEEEQNLNAYGSNQVVVGYISKNGGSEMKVTKALTTWTAALAFAANGYWDIKLEFC